MNRARAQFETLVQVQLFRILWSRVIRIVFCVLSEKLEFLAQNCTFLTPRLYFGVAAWPRIRVKSSRFQVANGFQQIIEPLRFNSTFWTNAKKRRAQLLFCHVVLLEWDLNVRITHLESATNLANFDFCVNKSFKLSPCSVHFRSINTNSTFLESGKRA